MRESRSETRGGGSRARAKSRNRKEADTTADVAATGTVSKASGASQPDVVPPDPPSQPAPDPPSEPPPKPLSCKELVKLHLHLLEKEHRTEVWDRQRLYGRDQLPGLLVVQQRRTRHRFHELLLRPAAGRDAMFPRNCISSRDSVRVRVGERWPTAVVRHKTDFELTLVMDKNKSKHVPLHTLVDVHKMHDDSTHERMCAALKALPSLNSGPLGCLRATLFAEDACPLEPPAAQLPPQLLDESGQLRLFNTLLDPSQRAAVEFTLRQQRLAIIHGPAGTGKTTTAVEAILQHVERGQRVLVCAPSNTAVDNLLEKLWEAELGNMVRLGHPARIQENLLDFWIDQCAAYLLDDWEKRLGEDWNDMPNEKQLKRKVIEDAEVVLCTLATASEQGPLKLTKQGGEFDLLVIDEATQALEAACWLAIPRAKKVLMFGDPEQLSPMLRNKSAEKGGLSVSLMERQLQLHGDALVCKLGVQYRMNEHIQEWSSGRYYGGLLSAAPHVLRHRLSQLPGVRDTAETGPTLLLIDTAGCRLAESTPDQTRSRQNLGEAALVAAHAAALAADGLLQQHMGVITPYAAQTAAVRAALRRHKLPDVEVNTVDGFQGREKEAILLSLVRSNPNRDVGFLGDKRRINVAVTRARRQLCVVCDTETVSSDEVLASLVTHLRRNGEVRSARKCRL
ncbi:DNA-binding protein SMUBP-2-like [Amphibalanus amphitrite]|uniref:DNA-binding protein SMUBP-2-like n=1 Tax=Amphibalanus amphitrite TaxID=1232801 RepID=UPI001C9149D1|nr:DNA-binding protein SMUBP-2-like [Amphibalanus amphitrite]XP_043245693.1 DNA-binding protein SMUBP-2-like [Amphibalanus amphitrite]